MEIKEEEIFEVEQAPLFNTRAPGHSQQNLRCNTLNHTSIVEQVASSGHKGPSFSNAISSVNYDAPD